MKQIELLYIDLFCGAGGTSSGVEYATVDGRRRRMDAGERTEGEPEAGGAEKTEHAK